eukprot:TRINITY_DN7199_c0_g2_i3.p1 TRINITY_DN7199_c0_g2~~TRINITY_DN7199_c0_g2_i3.p1  ORF type:complete len:408 (+),score=67.63 TRINITY_DN7199_c0_g2_i3:805-2028(+)
MSCSYPNASGVGEDSGVGSRKRKLEGTTLELERARKAIRFDELSVFDLDLSPFSNLQEMWDRLLPFHVFLSEDVTDLQNKRELAEQLVSQSNSLINQFLKENSHAPEEDLLIQRLLYANEKSTLDSMKNPTTGTNAQVSYPNGSQPPPYGPVRQSQPYPTAPQFHGILHTQHPLYSQPPTMRTPSQPLHQPQISSQPTITPQLVNSNLTKSPLHQNLTGTSLSSLTPNQTAGTILSTLSPLNSIPNTISPSKPTTCNPMSSQVGLNMGNLGKTGLGTVGVNSSTNMNSSINPGNLVIGGHTNGIIPTTGMSPINGCMVTPGVHLNGVGSPGFSPPLSGSNMNSTVGPVNLHMGNKNLANSVGTSNIINSVNMAGMMNMGMLNIGTNPPHVSGIPSLVGSGQHVKGPF